MKIVMFSMIALVASFLTNTAFAQLADPTTIWQNPPPVQEADPCMKNPPRAVKYRTTPLAEATRKADLEKGLMFYNRAQTEAARVYIRNGMVYGLLPNGTCARIVDSNRNKKGHFHYVMDEDGNFYIFDEKTFPKIRHSCVLGNYKPQGAVAGAGEIQFTDGHITYIDADSGHYSSGGLLFENVKSELRSRGVEIK